MTHKGFSHIGLSHQSGDFLDFHIERRTSMITRASYLTTRFGGYLHREVPEEDAELSHVGPDTPCGEYLRRFWQPICFSDELKDLPHRVKILCEELVVFRDLSGTVGLLELHFRTAARPWSSGLSTPRGYDAVTMAGSSRRTGPSSRRRASRPIAP
jgi:hypothetical protein